MSASGRGAPDGAGSMGTAWRLARRLFGANYMESFVSIVMVILWFVKAIYYGRVRMKEAEAAKVWAERADPMNPNVLLPSGGKRA